jgi:hypothetical protein
MKSKGCNLEKENFSRNWLIANVIMWCFVLCESGKSHQCVNEISINHKVLIKKFRRYISILSYRYESEKCPFKCPRSGHTDGV